MNTILYTVLALIAVVLAQAPETPQIQRGRDVEQQRPLDRDRPDRGDRGDRGFRIESPVFLQCTCSDPAGFNRCRAWRCLDLDVDRRR